MNGTSMYAGFWRRVVAVILDGLVLGIVTVPLNLAFGGGDDLGSNSGMYYSPEASSIGTVLGWLYYALMESSAKQATLGKMALGIIVTDLEGRRIGFGKATGRHFAKILSALILGIGFLMVAFTQRKQGLHDILAGTLVVKGQAPSQAQTMTPPPPPPPPPPLSS
jgi:uncharacterized RDD family membrane protein YckC